MYYFAVVLLDFDDLFDDDDLVWYKEEQDLIVVYNIVNILLNDVISRLHAVELDSTSPFL